MSEEVLHSYSLTSLEEPSDEMLTALMEKVGEAARESSRRVREQSRQMLCETFERIKRKKDAKHIIISNQNGGGRR